VIASLLLIIGELGIAAIVAYTVASLLVALADLAGLVCPAEWPR